MMIKSWHINVVIGLLACSSFTAGAYYVSKVPVEQGVVMEDTASYKLIQEPLNQLKTSIISKDVKGLSSILTGNGFEMTKEDYNLFLKQFKTKGDVTLFINELENQAASFVKGADLSSRYYYLDGTVENTTVKINKINVKATFGTTGTAKVGKSTYNLDKSRTVNLEKVLPVNQTIKASVNDKWNDSYQLNLFNSFIGKETKLGSGLDVPIRLFNNGAGLVVHINTNVDNGILYVNNKRTNRVVTSGGCFRDQFSEGDTIRVEFGGKKSKEYKVDKDKLSADLQIGLDEFLPDSTIPPKPANNDKLCENFLNAIAKSVSNGNSSSAKDLVADGYEYLVDQTLAGLMNQYSELEIKNIYVKNTNTSSDKSSSSTITLTYIGTTHNNAKIHRDGVATIQFNSDNEIIGFTLQ